jgi:hypothetical protein
MDFERGFGTRTTSRGSRKWRLARAICRVGGSAQPDDAGDIVISSKAVSGQLRGHRGGGIDPGFVRVTIRSEPAGPQEIAKDLGCSVWTVVYCRLFACR